MQLFCNSLRFGLFIVVWDECLKWILLIIFVNRKIVLKTTFYEVRIIIMAYPLPSIQLFLNLLSRLNSYLLYLSMKLKKWKALIFMQITLAANFMLLGYIFYDQVEYRHIILSACFIGVLACIYEAIRIYRKNNNPKP